MEQVFFDEDLVTIADYIENNKDTYSSYHRIMMEGNLFDPLSSYNPFGRGFTLFLPTDEAFERYIRNNDKYSSLDELIDDRSFTALLGRYHLVHIDLKTNEFPYGALPDTTATGDLLTIGFSSDLDSTVYKVNNVAPVVEGNLEMVNGYIHVISEVLEPVNYSGFQWLEDNAGYSILAGALDITGLKDTLGIYRTGSSGQLVKNRYTLLVEHDSIFNRYGILNTEDLITEYGTPGMPYTSPDNALYQFAAYHILEGEYFLVDFTATSNYNTFANAPLRIAAGLEVSINPGVDTFRLEISESGDTTAITHISLFYQESNILTKNGAIHFISEVMEFYVPVIAERSFQFYEEPEINKVRNTPGTYYFFEEDKEKLEVIDWTGPKQIKYFKSSSSSELAAAGDYIEIEGNFIINYTIPKILPGRYNFFLRAHALNNNNEHATILIYIDGKRMSGNYNLNSGGSSTAPYNVNNDWRGYEIGIVEFSNYTEHTITVETLIPGKFIWDYVGFYFPED
jgi:uncharacterized surface protein with fasciclin (FAS1) repeats